MAELSSEEWKYKCEVRIEYPRDFAQMVKNTMEVDKELRPQLVRRTYSVEENHLVALFEAKACRDLRTSMTSFFDMVLLATRTVNTFGSV